MSDALLSCRGLTMRFGGVVALDHLDLDVYGGEVLGLLGPNGSGKTTCFNVITGVYLASGGQIMFDGREITGYTAQQIYRTGITRTFQRSRLCLTLSIFDNVMVGNHQGLSHSLWFNVARRGALRRQIAQAYDEARELLGVFSAKLADRILDPAGSVAMIDRRRIEICRALISRPRVLLLDEPSAGMTHEETRELMDDILTVRQRIPGLSVVIIEHEMNVIERITERCVVLNYGRKLCEGSYREIAANADVQQAYLGQS
ncbi:ABC transporter ATP-binding protein [Castellaniella sp. S9]|uniref:ABC transporter ATP-binding protein n=1 Tax=Castellaniella sp. S9 TaxID=2993652 RepID=UPI0022B2FD32|nr:ABC transporter ATP-binding protein [Castellaniella sp. S9]